MMRNCEWITVFLGYDLLVLFSIQKFEMYGWFLEHCFVIFTALHMAAANGHMAIVEYLISEGVVREEQQYRANFDKIGHIID